MHIEDGSPCTFTGVRDMVQQAANMVKAVNEVSEQAKAYLKTIGAI